LSADPLLSIPGQTYTATDIEVGVPPPEFPLELPSSSPDSGPPSFEGPMDYAKLGIP